MRRSIWLRNAALMRQRRILSSAPIAICSIPRPCPHAQVCYGPAPVDIAQEIQKRRTFAIISHPDVGKTTLTEKLLLYGGAVQLAGSVTARKNQRATTSDWMELERKRGISISSTVLQFDYNG